MSYFITPFIMFVCIFGLGFVSCCWFFKRYFIEPLQYRISQLEEQQQERLPVTTIPTKFRQFSPRIRYIPVERHFACLEEH